MSFAILYKLLTLQYLYPFSGGERISAGQLTSLVNDVRRKSFDQVSWVDASDEETIYNNDKIFTDNNSKAQIKFESGNLITINEESLFKVSIINNTINLDMERGSFIADLTSDAEVLLFILGGKEYKVKSKKGKIKITGNQISLLSGEASLVSGSSKLELKQGEIAKLDEHIEFVEKFPAKLNIIDAKTYYIQKDKGLTLNWESLKKLKLESSFDISFEKRSVYSPLDNTFVLHLQEGMNYIRFIDPIKNQISNITSMNIIYETVPEITLDRNKVFSGEEVSFKDNFEGKWSYEIRLGDKTLKTSSLKHSFQINEVGSQSVLFKVDDPDRLDALWSKPLQVEVLSLPKRGPRILSPTEGQEFYLYGDHGIVNVEVDNTTDATTGVLFQGNKLLLSDENKTELTINKSGTQEIESFFEISDQVIGGSKRKFHVYLEPSGLDLEQGAKFILKKPGQEVDFDWAGVASANYLLEISNDRNFQKIAKTKNVKGLTAKMSFSKTGEMFWRAKKINKDGTVEYGSPKKIILSKPLAPSAPKIRKVIKKRVTTNILNSILDFIFPAAYAAEDVLEWTPVNDVESYRVEIYRGEKLLINEIVNDNAISIQSLTPGSYKYRIASIDYWEQQGEFSEFATLIIEKVVKNPIINLIAPEHRQSFDGDEVIKFEWEAVEGENVYNVELSNSLSFKITKEFKVKGSMFELDAKKMRLNKIFWRVSAGKWKSKRRYFEVKQLTKASEIKKASSRRSKWLVYFSPRKTSRETSRAKIDGVDMISFGGSYYFDYQKFNFTASFDKSSGKVFNDLSYSENTFSLKGLYPVRSFDLGMKLSIRNGNDYKVESNKVVEARTTNFSVGLETKVWDLSLGYTFVGLSGLDIRYDFPLSLYKKNFVLTPQFVTRDSEDYGKETSFGLLFGISL